MDSVISWLNASEERAVHLNGTRMNGHRAVNSDWSDEDAVVSGSATEADESTVQRKKKTNKHTTKSIKSLNSKFDPVHVILDKIDAELNSLAAKSQSSSATDSTVVRRSSRDNTDLNGSYDQSGTLHSRTALDDVDTGLGTGSGHGDTVSDKFINGTAEIYSDVPENDISRRGVTSDLDSVTAHHVNDRFQEIMRRKKGNSSDNLRRGPPQSDAETIRTEDFEDRFRDTMVHQSDSDTLEFKSEDSSDTLTDDESVNRDKVNWDYFESRPKSKKGSRNGRHHFRSHTVDANPSRPLVDDPDETGRKCLTPPLQTHKRGGNSMPPLYPRTNNFDSMATIEDRLPRARQKHRKNYTSDADSVRTEDFEIRFNNLLVKPGDISDSQGELTDNDPLHAKVKQILQVTAPYKHEDKLTNVDRDRSPTNINRDSGRYSWRDGGNSNNVDSRTLNNTRPKGSSSVRTEDSLDEDRKEIEIESARIQQEMEQERRRTKSLSPRRETKSPTRTMLSLSANLERSSSQQELSGRTSPIGLQTGTSLRNKPSDSLEGSRSSLGRISPVTNGHARSPLGGGQSSNQEGRPQRTSSPLGGRLSSSQDGLPVRSNSPLSHKLSSSHEERPGSVRNSRSGSPIAERLSSGLRSSSPRNSEEKLSVSFQEFPTSEIIRPRETSKSLTFIELPPSIFKSSIRGGSVLKLDNPEDFEEMMTDLKTTQEDLHNTSVELKSARVQLKDAEKHLKIVNAKTEDARTQLMLTEFKRDNTIKDLERLQEDLARKKRQVKDYEDQLRSRIGEIRHIDAQGIDENMAELIKENESLKVMLRHNDGLELERDELVRQLELAKEDLFNEQRNSRNKIEELKEELENVTGQIDENKSSHEQMQKKLDKMEASYRQMEKEKNEIIQEQSLLYKEVRDQAKKDHMQARQRSTSEAQELREEISELCTKINSMQAEAREKEDLVLKSREQILELRKQLTREVNIKDGLIEDHKRTLQSLRKEMDTAMVQLRENLFLDKQKSLEDVRNQLEKDRHSSVMRLEEKLNHQYAEHAKIVKAKEEEIEKFLTLIKNMEQDKKTMEDRIRQEYKTKMQEEVQRERANMETNLAWKLQQERDQIKKEEDQKIKSITKGYEQERKLRENLSEQVRQFKKELEDQKQKTKQAIHDKLIDVARAKELMKREMQAEFEKATEKLKQEHHREIEKLQATIRLQEDELQKLKSERQKALKQELDHTSKSYRSERMIVNELNEECRKTAGILGISPRKINLSDFRGGENHIPNGIRSKSATTASLANLRACNEELRNHVQELRQEMELQRAMLTRAERDKGDMVQNLKLQLEREKNAELEKMKDKLLKGVSMNEYHSLLNMPNNDLATMQHGKQYPKIPQYEFHPRSETQQQEIERLEREIRRLAMVRFILKRNIYLRLAW
ncbi:hypothetical protein KUTeg_009716 [Tegillarca granosa]|uniref:Uncharacterized protein n=1 Tax=Tegillarca granosa TaxID=220873 RepID=A0ABQ9F9R1_TEGGR|nr:hypothetical protein KUTeg_009716 [Tegillarca granosa]